MRQRVDDVLMTPGDVARLLGVTADGVRKIADRGELKVERTSSGERLFWKSEVDALVARRNNGVGKPGRRSQSPGRR